MPELTPARRRELKAQAHKLDPVVMIGGAGLSSAVLAEIDRSLKSHELIKVRVNAERAVRDAVFQEICRQTGAQPVQHIGKILVIFRMKPDSQPTISPSKPNHESS